MTNNSLRLAEQFRPTNIQKQEILTNVAWQQSRPQNPENQAHFVKQQSKLNGIGVQPYEVETPGAFLK